MYRETATRLLGNVNAMLGGQIWKVLTYVMGSLATAAIVYTLILQAERDKALRNVEKARIEAATMVDDLATCRANVTRYTEMVDQQNEALRRLKVEGERKQAEAQKALDAARADAARRRAAASRRADALGNPTPGSADCKDAISIVRKELVR